MGTAAVDLCVFAFVYDKNNSLEFPYCFDEHNFASLLSSIPLHPLLDLPTKIFWINKVQNS